MVEYTDFEIESSERRALIDLLHHIDRTKMNQEAYPFEQHPLFSKIISKLNSLKFKRDKLEVSITEESTKYKADQLQKIEEELRLIIETLEFINDLYKQLTAQTKSYRSGIYAFIKGSELLQTFSFLQDWAMSSHQDAMFSTELSIKLLEERRVDNFDVEAFRTFKNKFSEQSKKLYNLVANKINEMINGPIG